MTVFFTVEFSVKYKNMNLIVAIIFSCLSFSAIAEMDFLEEAQIGKYILIGKAIDSGRTYLGKVEIYARDETLFVNRQIEGQSITGTAAIEPVLNGEAKVLRIRFSENGKAFEETCLFNGDLDNYSRISCYLYQSGVDTINPGLEAFFHDHSAD